MTTLTNQRPIDFIETITSEEVYVSGYGYLHVTY